MSGLFHLVPLPMLRNFLMVLSKECPSYPIATIFRSNQTQRKLANIRERSLMSVLADLFTSTVILGMLNSTEQRLPESIILSASTFTVILRTSKSESTGLSNSNPMVPTRALSTSILAQLGILILRCQ